MAASSRASSSGCLDPAGELVLPGPQRHPPGRVGGHDVAGAAGQAAALQGGGQPFGHGREPGVGPRWRVVGQGQGVVLVGAEGALPAGAAAEHEQRVRAGRRAQLRLGVADGPDVQGVVGAGHEPGDVGGRGAGPDQGGRGRRDLGRVGGQLVGAAGPLQLAPDEQGMAGLLPQQVGVGDHAHQPSLPGERQVVDAPVDHGQQQLPEAGVGRHGPQRRGHHLAHRRVRGQAVGQHPVAEVGGGHQAGRLALHDQRRHPLAAHAPGRLGHRLGRRAGHQRPRHQLAGLDLEQAERGGEPGRGQGVAEAVAGPPGQQRLEPGWCRSRSTCPAGIR